MADTPPLTPGTLTPDEQVALWKEVWQREPVSGYGDRVAELFNKYSRHAEALERQVASLQQRLDDATETLGLRDATITEMRRRLNYYESLSHD
jgi:hypothetical protein